MIKKLLQSALIALALAVIPIASASAVATGYDGAVINPESDGVTYNVVAGAGDTVALTGVAGVGTLNVTFKNNVSGSIVITPSASRPSEASSNANGTTNLYFDVDLNGMSDTDVNGAKLTFTITKAWLTANGFTSANIVLQHFGTNWTNLTTREISSTATTVTFEATITSFSPFAIVAVPGLSNTGSPYMVGAIIAIAALAIVGGTFIISRKQRNSLKL
jgi:PGF-pre-PGF domain-containing protein